MTDSTRVAGEPVEDLLAVFRNLDVAAERDVDGLTDVSLKLNDAENAIFRRALMRLEAELLVEDADGLDVESMATLRTSPQRRHDAFMLLLQRVIEAGAPPA